LVNKAMTISAAIRPMRMSEVIRPRDDTGLIVHSEIVMTLRLPHSKHRTVTVRRSGPMSMPLRASALQCGQSTTGLSPSRHTTKTCGAGSGFDTAADPNSTNSRLLLRDPQLTGKSG
jgi:hypothetical protein